MSSQQGPGLIGQFFEYFLGVTWSTDNQDKKSDERAPLCGACRNVVRRVHPSAKWQCPYHPNASLIERESPADVDER